jgi:hypothetical protein
MTTTLSSAAFAISASSFAPLKAKRHGNSASFYSQNNPLNYSPLSTRPSIPRYVGLILVQLCDINMVAVIFVDVESRDLDNGLSISDVRNQFSGVIC